MTILVVGSTGTLGCLAAEAARAAGHTVVAMVRDRLAPTARRLQQGGVQLRVADLKEPAQLDAAVAGVTSVIITATATLSRRDQDSLDAVDGRGIQALLTACIRNGVRHVVLVSFSRGIDADTPLSRFKRAAERRLENSAMEYTILLPSYFPEKFMTPLVGVDVAAGRARIFGDGTQPVSYVATADVARLAACCAAAPRGLGAIPMGGPEDFTQLEVVEMLERLTNKKLALEYMSLEQIEGTMRRTTDPLKQSHLGLYRGLAIGDPLSTDWASPFGLTPTTVETCLRQMLGLEQAGQQGSMAAA